MPHRKKHVHDASVTERFNDEEKKKREREKRAGKGGRVKNFKQGHGGD
jgi:hypothetical protein